MFWRIAWHVSDTPERGRPHKSGQRFYEMLVGRAFFPNSPDIYWGWNSLGQLAACFVLPVSDDMGRANDGIFSTLRNAALIQQTGGNGFQLSRLRPSGSHVKASAGRATGRLVLKVYDNAFGEIAQGGTRRGANMGVLRIDHPDIEDFIVCKTSETAITNFNISLGITDDFMKAVEEDGDWDLRFPDVHAPEYKSFKGTISQAEKAGLAIKTYKTVKARDLFNKFESKRITTASRGAIY